MRVLLPAGIVLTVSLVCADAPAQRQLPLPAPGRAAAPPSGTAPGDPSVTVDLNWTPPEFSELSAEAATRSSFSLDRTTLGIAEGLIPESDAEARQAIAKLDGVSGHILSFAAAGPDDALVSALRHAYNQHGWKHLVTNTSAAAVNPNAKGPLSNSTTDVWVVMDGSNLRGAVALVESPRNLTLITLAGNISPVDLLHLRGHFGIPRYDTSQFTGQREKNDRLSCQSNSPCGFPLQPVRSIATPNFKVLASSFDHARKGSAESHAELL